MSASTASFHSGPTLEAAALTSTMQTVLKHFTVPMPGAVTGLAPHKRLLSRTKSGLNQAAAALLCAPQAWHPATRVAKAAPPQNSQALLASAVWH
jgi:hypothetical protein